MAKLMLTVLAVVFCVTMAISVEAEPAKRTGTVAVTDRTPVSAEQARCIRRCLEQRSAADCRSARTGARRAWRRLLARLDTYESRITALEGRLGGLSDRDPELQRQLDELTDRVSQLNVRIDAVVQLAEDIEDVQLRLGDLEDGQESQDRELEDARERIARLEAQIERVSRRNGTVELSLSGGFTGIYSLDGSSYTGGLLGARLALHVTRMLYVFVEPMVTMAYDQYPVGTVVRGGLLIELAGGHAMLEAAVSGMWVGFNAQLEAVAAYITVDLGLEYRPVDLIGLGLTFNAGIELDACGPATAFGGTAYLRINIPRL